MTMAYPRSQNNNDPIENYFNLREIQKFIKNDSSLPKITVFTRCYTVIYQ